ncbi:hypothetical protein L202_06816 [Cryptococcus amylolentus CBS 6039]|uniref:Integrase core domain-containing protein n=2 Tax=Cryptococcus amylolentus TaxID=104669 RepID=A0A1E3HF74_9TREE|nr:hypothetical protein L202_06816 [Cryptococcus amylolentus CBS 6039]ODN74416.1 hypothetical protein L202_06816 [Cryptococcus amylolentus CBS 6039]ODO01423.1 hypothetical protein I350_06242 [Cryptococcus amylolentus CBS 6273]
MLTVHIHPADRNTQVAAPPPGSLGPDEQWSINRNDKLSQWGFSIYGIRDAYSGYILDATLLPSSNMSKNAQYFYVCAVYDRQGFPLQLASNRENEMDLTRDTQKLFRQMRPLNKTQFKKHSPNVEHRSQKHVGIEIQWSTIWRNVLGTFEKYVAPEEQEDFSFDDPVHRVLFHWVTVPVIKSMLEEEVKFHRTYPVRRQRKKALNPSGGSREDAYHDGFPGASDCLTNLWIMGKEGSQMFEDLLVETQDEATLTWWDDDQEKILETAHARVFAKLGMCPLLEEIGVAGVWTLFGPMLELVQAPLEAYFESK